MKRLSIFLCLSLAVSGINVSAQRFKSLKDVDESNYVLTDSNIDEETGKRDRNCYLTNPWFSNWSVGLAGGIQALVSGTGEHNSGIDFGTSHFTPAIELTVGKWFTPTIGLRAGLQGFWFEEHFQLPGSLQLYNHYMPKHDEGTDHNYYTSTYLHGDIMWNVINTFWGYQNNRLYNVIPYAQFGYMRLCHPDHSLFTTTWRDREFVVGGGILNTFRINNSFQATLDLRWDGLDGRYHDVREGDNVNHISILAGIVYNIENWHWVHAAEVGQQIDEAKTDADAAIAALNDVVKKNEDLKNQLRDAKDELAKVEKLPAEDFRKRVAEAEHIVYYEINISKVNITESRHLDSYIKEVMEINPKHVFYLTGSADEGTGNFEINTRLSHDRAYGIKDILMNEYNIPEEQIVIKNTIISSEHEDGALDRCVLMENK